MKGIVFTEFMDMVEDRYGLAVADRIIQEASLPSGGAYTAVGTYPPTEMLGLLGRLSAATGLGTSELLRVFGEHLFLRLARGFPQLLDGWTHSFDLLERIEGVIHPEVRKLYPDAELPQFETSRQGRNVLVMVYRSPRGLADLAEGLITGCAKWYGQSIQVGRQDLSGGLHTHERFTLTLAA